MFDCGHSLAPRAEGKTPEAEALLAALEAFASYDSLNGGFVVTKVRRGNVSKPQGALLATSQMRRGRPHSKDIRLLGEMRSEHLLVWLWHGNEWPAAGEEFDHIDRDPFNNRIENLRLVPHSINSRNQSKSAANTTGVTGVSFDKRVSRYRATVRYKGQLYYNGGYGTIEEAAEARRELIQRLNKNGAGFTETHGE